MINVRKVTGGIIVSVKVQPSASQNRITGEHADQMKIAVTTAPEKGKANKEVIKVIAQHLGIKRSDIQIISGEKSREKKVFIRNLNEKDFNRNI